MWVETCLQEGKIVVPKCIHRAFNIHANFVEYFYMCFVKYKSLVLMNMVFRPHLYAHMTAVDVKVITDKYKMPIMPFSDYYMPHLVI